MPSEIIVNKMMFETKSEISKIKERFNVYVSLEKEENFNNESELLINMYNVINEKEKIKTIEEIQNQDDKNLVVPAINALLTYLTETQKTNLDHINTIKIYNISQYMALDINARRNLELTEKMVHFYGF